ncbi:MAG: urease accessory protein UreE [Pelistega sp.]|nr:urease accessory protein UreE [Pelistega sp.]
MITVTKFLRKGSLAPAILRQARELTMTLDERRRARQKLQLADGSEVGLFLEHGVVLQDGDILLSEDNRFLIVRAAKQALIHVTAPDQQALARAAYHLGNRHVLLEVGADYLHVEPDPILEQMLRQLGVTVSHIEAPFLPETGAYGGGHKHGHDETFAEDYALAQEAYHAHEHGHSHGHSHGHQHSASCSHGHHHGHNHDHQHAHGQSHSHDNDHAHKHSASCNHDHSHDHKHSASCNHEHSHDHKHSASCVHDHSHDHGHSHSHAHEHKHGHEHTHEHKHEHGQGDQQHKHD